jgi:hypothetical protein
MTSLTRTIHINSDLMIVASRKLSNVSAITWEEPVNFQWDDDEVHFVLDQLT